VKKINNRGPMFMMVLKRKQIVIAAIVLLIAISGYLNWTYDRGDDGGYRSTGVSSSISSEDLQEEANLEQTNALDEEGGEFDVSLGEATLVKKDFFAQARLDREAGRSKAIETFNTVLENENSDQQVKMSAQEQVLDIAKNTEIEVAIENLIKAKGFEDAVCYITGKKCNIVVKSPGLSQADVAKIMDIAIENTNFPAENIKIVEIE